MHMGLCFPDSCYACNPDHNPSCDPAKIDLVSFLFDLSVKNNLKAFPYPYFYKDVNTTIEWTDADSVAVAVISLLATCIIIGTIIDIALRHGANDYIPDKAGVFFQGFSLYTVLKKIFHVAENKEGLASINGIRFWSMVWVIVGHTYLFTSVYKSGNPTFLENSFQEKSMRLILNATVSVDSFFMIGGCLLSYLTLKEIRRLNGGSFKFWIMFYVHRYIRLTGAYAGVVLFAASLSKYLPNAIEHSFLSDYKGCAEDWWKNLLYIQTLYPDEPKCLGQTWYLAVEMQIFIITPILLFLMYKHPIAGNIFTGTTIQVKL